MLILCLKLTAKSAPFFTISHAFTIARWKCLILWICHSNRSVSYFLHKFQQWIQFVTDDDNFYVGVTLILIWTRHHALSVGGDCIIYENVNDFNPVKLIFSGSPVGIVVFYISTYRVFWLILSLSTSWGLDSESLRYELLWKLFNLVQFEYSLMRWKKENLFGRAVR